MYGSIVMAIKNGADIVLWEKKLMLATITSFRGFSHANG